MSISPVPSTSAILTSDVSGKPAADAAICSTMRETLATVEDALFQRRRTRLPAQ